MATAILAGKIAKVQVKAENKRFLTPFNFLFLNKL